MAEFKLQGATVEEKLAHAETVLARLLRKREAMVLRTVPNPTGIYAYCAAPDVTGLIGRWVSPISGTITGLWLYALSIVEKGKPYISLRTKHGSKRQTSKFSYKAGNNEFAPSVPIEAGTIIEIYTTLQDKVAELSIGMLVTPAKESSDAGTPEE